MTIKKNKRRKRIYIQLLDDNINSFEYVIKCLMTVCQAQQCALITHNIKSCNVSSGFAPEVVGVYMQLIKYGLTVGMSTNKNN